MLNASENPPMLPPGTSVSPEAACLAGARWWAAHTKSRVEKAFAWDLLHRGIGYFLPMVERVRFSGGRKRRVQLPLFPSYVFFCGQWEERHAALATNRLCRVLEIDEQDLFLRQISAVEKALRADTEVELYPRVAVGERCRIVAGPLRGEEGIVVELKTRARVVLQVSVLSCGALFETERDFVEPLGDAPPRVERPGLPRIREGSTALHAG